MSTVYLRTAANCPTPITPVSLALGDGSSGPFFSGMVAGATPNMNQGARIGSLLGLVGGGGYGIVSGCGLSVSSGLNVLMSAGVVQLDQQYEFVSSAPAATNNFQLLLPVPYTLANNTVNFVWLTTAGALVSATTIAPPAGARVFLGAVTTLSGAITVIDGSGVVNITGGSLYRVTADAGAPTDSPPVGMQLQTFTLGGVYIWVSDGTTAYHALQPVPAYRQSGGGAPVTATASETQGAVATIAANRISAGTVLRLTYWGRITGFHTGDTVQVRIRFGATTLTGTTVVPGAAVSNVGGMIFKGSVDLVGYAAPSASSPVVGMSDYNDPVQAVTSVVRNLSDLAPTNFATNAGLLIEGTIQFSSNNSSNSGLFDGFILEQL